MEWRENASRLDTFIKDVSLTPPEISFPKPSRVRPNRLRTFVGLFRLETQKYGIISTVTSKCDAKEQTAEQVILLFPICHQPNRVRILSDVDKSLVIWLTEICSGV